MHEGFGFVKEGLYMDRDVLKGILADHFSKNFDIIPIKENLFQVFAPYYYSDGDMMDIFIMTDSNNEQSLKVCDCGLTLMRLSYDFNIDSDKKKALLQNILNEYNVINNNENLIIETKVEYLFQAILSMTQVISKISGMSMFSRDLANSQFYEKIQSFIHTKLIKYNPIENYVPVPDKDYLTVDYCFQSDNKPVFLFAVKTADKAKNAVIAMLTFQNEDIPFIGVVVHQNYDDLSSKEKRMVMQAADKQFYDIDDFIKGSAVYLPRALN